MEIRSRDETTGLTKYLLSPFIVLAGIGLVLSLIVHLYSFFGLNNPFGNIVWGLHLGIFIVWLPTVLVGQKLAKDFKRKDFWKAALRGCPPWLKRLTILFFVYAIVNFILFILNDVSSPNKAEKEIISIRGFSGHWMAFYSASLAVLYSATQVHKFDKSRRCRNGHPVSPSAKFCEECGAEVAE